GPFRGAVAEVRGGGDGGARSGSAVVSRLLPDPEVPVAGVSQRDTVRVRGVVSRLALGAASGADRGTPQPNQPSGDQAKDVEMEEETARASAPPAVEENLC